MNIMLAFSDAVWNALIAACLAAYLEWVRRKTVSKVEEVKKELEVKTKPLPDIHATVQKSYTLVNGNMSETLRIGMVSALLLAHKTGLEDHLQLAKTATDKFEAHSKGERRSALASKENLSRGDGI